MISDTITKYSSTIQLVEHLKRIMPKNVSIVDEIADVLELSNDSVYRRLRGETSFSFDEVITLSAKYHFSLDMFAPHLTGKVSFNYKTLGNETVDLESYLENILKDFSILDSIENATLYYAAEGIPIFYHWEYEYLTPFKFYFWKKAILNDPLLEKKKFDVKCISNKTLELAQKIAQLYSSVSSTEIWTNEAVESTLSQIKYSWESGDFASKKDALNVCNDLMKMLNHLCNQANTGLKFSQKEKEASQSNVQLSLYACDIQIGNNAILVTSDTVKVSLLSFNTFNTLLTQNADYCLENERWISNLIKKSVLISGVSEKQRFQFFKQMTNKVECLINNIENS